MQTNITYFLQKATLGPTHREIDENAPKAQIKPEETQRAANRALGHAQHMPLAAPASNFVQSPGRITDNEARGTAVHFGTSYPSLLG